MRLSEADMPSTCPTCGKEDCPADAAYRMTGDSKHGRMAKCKSEVARYWMARALKAEQALRTD